MTTLDQAKHHVEAAAPDDKEDVFEILGRAGYTAKGITYLIVAAIAIWAAFAAGSQDAEGSRGALGLVAEQPGGTWIVTALGVGLAAYALWQFSRLFVDPEDEGNDKSGLAKRVFLGGSGVIHTSLAIFAFTAAFSGGGGGGGSGSGGGGGGTQGLVSMALGWPMGWLLVIAAGLGVLGFGLYQLYKAYKVKLTSKLAMQHMSAGMKKFTTIVARGGLGARGVVFSLVGALVIWAGYQGQSSKAGGSETVLEMLGSFGPWVLGAVALGLGCYGLYMLVKARYRRIAGEHPDE